MKMNKKYILGAIGWLTGFLIYNLVLFVLIGGVQTTPSFWCSYLFVLVAFGMQLLVTFLAYGKNGIIPRDLFLGYPISRSAGVYLVVELVAASIIMLFPACDIKLAFVIQILILGVEIVFLVSGLLAKDHAEKMEEKENQQVFFVRNLSTDVAALLPYAQDAGLQKDLKSLAEELRYSDPVSHEALAQMENYLINQIAYLGACLREGRSQEATPLCNDIRNALKERNAKCKILK